MPRKFTIDIPDFAGGFAPAYWANTYPSRGKKNQAGDMQNVDLTDLSVLTQGPGLSTLTNGNENGVVSTAVKSIIDEAIEADRTFGVGGDKFYELSSSTVTDKASSPTLPHTITKAGATTITAEDIAYYQNAIYYTYNYDNTEGDMGKYDMTRDADADFDDDIWSTTLEISNTALKDAPHPIVKGGDDKLYIGNGRYVSSLDGATGVEDDLTLPQNTEIEDSVWHANQLWVASNCPNLTGANKSLGSVYLWDTYSDSWNDEITIPGRVSALRVKNGVVFVWYQDISSDGGYKLAYFNGRSIEDVAHYKGPSTPALSPAYYQHSEYKNFLVWQSNGKIYAWGSPDFQSQVYLFQFMDGGYSNVNAVATPFGDLLIASDDGSSSYKIAKNSGYDTSCNWKSILFDVTRGTDVAMLDRVILRSDVLASGSQVDLTLKDNQGTSLWTDTYSYSGDGAITWKEFITDVEAQNFRIEFDWSNGSTSNDVAIRRVTIQGHTMRK